MLLFAGADTTLAQCAMCKAAIESSTNAAAASTEIQQADTQDAALAQKIADLRIQEIDDAILQAEQAADWRRGQGEG